MRESSLKAGLYIYAQTIAVSEEICSLLLFWHFKFNLYIMDEKKSNAVYNLYKYTSNLGAPYFY